MSKKVSDILPKTEILAQLAEEASELAQAALKLRRALDGTNPTPKSVEECEENLLEELPTKKCTSQRLKECSIPEKQKAYRATGRPAWTCSAGGWKMTT